MTPKSAKAKGRRLQDQVAREITDTLCLPEGVVRPAIMGESGCDIKIERSHRREFPFNIECKNQERLSIWAAIDQARINSSEPFTIPVVVFKRNRSDIWAALPWDAFLELVKNGLLRREK